MSLLHTTQQLLEVPNVTQNNTHGAVVHTVLPSNTRVITADILTNHMLSLNRRQRVISTIGYTATRLNPEGGFNLRNRHGIAK